MYKKKDSKIDDRLLYQVGVMSEVNNPTDVHSFLLFWQLENEN